MSKKYTRTKPLPLADRRLFLESTLERFWSKVDRGGRDECWPWTGTLLHPNPAGMRYGQFAITNGGGGTYSYRAHRLAWMLMNGPIPESQVIMHTCDTPACCNPNHLIAGTQAENVLDQAQKLRTTIGERNRHAKLAAEDVLLIRRSDEPDSVLAKRYGVWASTIYAIRIGTKWKHLPGARPDFYEGRQKAGQKLTPEMRAEIIRRRGLGESIKSVAADFGIAPGYVSVVASRTKRYAITGSGDRHGS